MAVVASCNGESARPTPTPTPSGEVVRFGYPAEPPTLDPLGIGGASAATRDILRPVLPALFRLDHRLRPQPELAAGWPSESDVRLDPFSVTVRLREAAWSDGTPITSGDVRFSFERLSEGPTGYRYRRLRSVDVVDDRTFTLRFDTRMRRWWSLFSLDDMVLPAHAYSESWAERPTVSGGPFSVAGWTEGLRVRLVRNDAYWGPKAIAAGIDVLFVPSDETRFQLLERGELDAFFSEGDINMGRRARARGYLRTDGALAGEKTASGAWGPSWWELDLEPEIGDGVAAGVVEALDPDLVAEILEDTGAPMNGIPAAFPVRPGPVPGTWTERGEVEEARADVARGGDTTFELSFPRGVGAGALANFAFFRLKDVGVTVELLGLESDAFERSLDDGSHAPAVLRIRRGADAPDAASYASFSGEPGSASVDDHVESARSAVPESPDPERPLTGLGPAPWAAAQDALEEASSAAPLARIRAWIVGREGLAGPHSLGATTGPFWNAATWRSL